MTLPDFVNETLTYLDTNWNTTNTAKGVFIDGDEMRRFDNDERAKSESAINEKLITVDSSPTGTGEAIGTEYDRAVRFGAGVDIEGYHTDGGGQFADKDAFDTFVTEAKTAILTNRTSPPTSSGEYGFTHLAIEEESDESPTAGDAHYFRYLFDVWFYGFEDLP